MLTVFPSSVDSMSSGPQDGYTNAPGQFTCMACHQNYPGDGSVRIQGVPENYTYSFEYSIEVILEDPGQVRWGFELTAIDQAGNGSGRFIITDPVNTQLSDNPSPYFDYVKQTLTGTFQGTVDGPVSWNFKWEAPESASGEVTFYIAALAANGDNTVNNDYVYSLSVISQPGSAPTFTPNPTATVPPGYPTSTPFPCETTGVMLKMPSHHFNPGDTFSLKTFICNTNSTTLTGYPLFIILDIFSEYWFAPSWISTSEGIDWYIRIFPPGLTTIIVIPEFSWPSGAQNIDGIIFWGAMTDPGMANLYGSMDSWEFGWSDSH